MQQSASWIFEPKITDVEDRAKPLVIALCQIEVGLEPHYACIGERSFVEVVEAIDNTHDRHDVQVDLPQEPCFQLLVDGNFFGVTAVSNNLQRLVRVLQVVQVRDLSASFKLARAQFSLYHIGRVETVVPPLLVVRCHHAVEGN